jgi:hypothetical protein
VIHDNHTECSEFLDMKCEVCVTHTLHRLLRLAWIMAEYLTIKYQIKTEGARDHSSTLLASVLVLHD